MLYFFFIFISLAQYVPHAFLKGKANRITISNVTVVEGNNLVFNVNLSRQAKADININWATANNTALSGTHYTANSGTLTILNGQSSGTITISSINHANVCANDVNFFVNLTATSSGIITDNQGVGTIQDDDVPTLTIASAGDVTEGTNAVVTVTLTPACNNKTLSFQATTTNGTATSGQDYTAQTNQLYSAAPGVTSVNVPVVTLDDVLDEDDSQSFTITISNPTNATIVTPSATMNILDNDASPTISVATTLSTIEGTALAAVVSLSAASERTVGFNYATNDGTAFSASGDYTAITSTSGTVAPGSTTTNIALNAINDGVVCEPDETFTFALSGISNAVSGNLTSTVTIIDFNKPTVTVANASGVEGSTFTFNVSLDFACPSNAMSFNYTTIDLTASNGADYNFTQNTVTIPATQTTSSFTVVTLDDTLREQSSESFLVTLTNLSFVKLGTGSFAQGTITDNEVGEVTTQVVAGSQQTCALSSTGRVKCWGFKHTLGYNGGHYGDEPGEMGDALPSPDFGTNASNFGSPHNVLSGFIEVSRNSQSGQGLSCVLLDNNRVKCMGGITFSGSLGVTINKLGDEPTGMGDNLPYVDLGTVNGLGITPLSVIAIANPCAIISNGGVKCWGENSSGQLGRGNNSGANLRIGDQAGEMGDNLPYVDLGTHDGLGLTNHTAKAIASNGTTVCVLLDDNRVKCWGSGSNGRLGTGATNTLGDNIFEMGDFLPYLNLGTGRTVKKLFNQCAILDNDRLKCWGNNGSNILNDALLGLGDLNHRGDNPGEMGDNLPYVDLGTRDGLGVIPHTVKDLSGGNPLCAILDDNRLKCWGNNFYGALGLGASGTLGDGPNEMGDNLPYVNLGTGRTALKVSGTFHNNAVLRDNGTVVAFGLNGFGQSGREDTLQIGDGPGEMGDALSAISLGSGRTVANFLVGGEAIRCAILDNGQIKCWGAAGAYGADGTARLRLGIGDNPGEIAGLPDVSLPAGRSIRQLTSHWRDGNFAFGFLGIFDNGSITSWGNSGPVLSGGSFGNTVASMGSGLPQATFAGGKTALKVSVGFNSACAIDVDLDLRCWNGGLPSLNGTGTSNSTNISTIPVALIGTGRKVIDISVSGSIYACALLDNLTVKCWGTENSWGNLGYGNTSQLGSTLQSVGDNLPAVDLGSVSYPVQVSVGAAHSCARFANGGIKCWGNNNRGQLGRGNTTNMGDGLGEMGDNLGFINLGTGRTAKQILAFNDTTCAIRDNDTLVCWGFNSSGECGNGSTSSVGDGANEMGDNLTPIDLNGLKPLSVSAERNHVCALLENNGVKCWGDNFWGQLGLGDSTNRGHTAGTMGAALSSVPINW